MSDPKSMRFRFPTPKNLGNALMEPHLEAKLPEKVEDKEGWSFAEALKDAVADAFKEAWANAAGCFSKTFLNAMEVFAIEMKEYVDFNLEKVEFTLRIPIRGLRWIPLKRFRTKDLRAILDRMEKAARKD